MRRYTKAEIAGIKRRYRDLVDGIQCFCLKLMFAKAKGIITEDVFRALVQLNR